MSSPDALLYQTLSEDEAAILDLETRALYTLNATARRVFERAREGATLDEIVDALREEFDAPPEVRADVEAFLDDLRLRGLLAPHSDER